MKIISINKPYEVEIKEINKPVPGKGEALLKMLYGGICGSDLGTYRGNFAYSDYPRVPGHEISAQIEEIRENDLGLRAGMVVTVNPYMNCGKCYSCRRGLVNACMSNQTLGCQRDGAFGEYFTIPVERIYDGKGIPAKTLAAVEPFCISFHGVYRAAPKTGEKVLIVGSGTIGILAMIAAKTFGAEVWMSDISEEKLNRAKALGAAGVFANKSPEDFKKDVETATNGDGFDVTIEAVGLAATFQNCIDSAAFGGRVVLIGISKQRLDFDFTVIQKKELQVFGSRNARKEDFMTVIDLLSSGKVNIDAVITDIFPFGSAAKAFQKFDTDGGNMLKTLLEF